jgi:hypothetical protein
MMKHYVDVIVLNRKDGKIMPLALVWSNGVRYPIDKVSQVTRAASTLSGGTGIRYTCRIQNQERYLYFEEDRWFIERKE